MLAESFVLLDLLIFKLVTTTDKEAAILAIPEVCVNKIIALYQTSLFAGHQGVVKKYLTMKEKFFIPNLRHYLRSFIKGCKGMSCVPTIKIQQTANKAVATSNLFELQTIIETEYGFEGDA